MAVTLSGFYLCRKDPGIARARNTKSSKARV
jgi:hypothetical protein